MNDRQSLSPEQGAFVIRFRSPADTESGRFTGRIEHVASGKVTRCQTADEFALFVRRVLRTEHLEGSKEPGIEDTDDDIWI